MDRERPGPIPGVALDAADFLRGAGYRSTGTIARHLGLRTQNVHTALSRRPEMFDTRRMGRRRVWKLRELPKVTDE